jgi:hypothetical protein
MPPVDTLKKLSAASGLAFGVFLVMHLMSHYMLNIGFEVAHITMIKFRSFYQNPLFEAALIVSLGTHMYANTMLYMKRSKINAKSKKEPGSKGPEGTAELTAHRMAGYYLSLSIFGHVVATRLGSVLMLSDPSMYDYTFLKPPFDGFTLLFPLYLCIFGVAGGWHLIYGTRSALAILSGSSVVGKPVPTPLKVLAMANHIAIVSAVLALGAYFKSTASSEKEHLIKEYYTTLGMH